MLAAAVFGLVVMTPGWAEASRCKAPKTWCKASKSCVYKGKCRTAVKKRLKTAACLKGQKRSKVTQGHCCWPGQAWNGKKCVGKPDKCPKGWTASLEQQACVKPGCKGGRVRMPGGQCCWPEQAWHPGKKACIGIPKCPPGTARQGTSCVMAKTKRAPNCRPPMVLRNGKCVVGGPPPSKPAPGRAARDLYRAGRKALSKGDKTTALRLFRKAADGGYAKAHRLMGNVFLQKGEIRKAIDAYNTFLRLQPNAISAEATRATIRRLGGQPYTVRKVKTPPRPARLSAKKIKAPLQKKKPAFRACLELMKTPRPDAVYQVRLRFTIRSSGEVASSKVTSGGGTTSAVQNCVLSVLENIRFDPFTDPSMTISYPVRLQ